MYHHTLYTVSKSTTARVPFKQTLSKKGLDTDTNNSIHTPPHPSPRVISGKSFNVSVLSSHRCESITPLYRIIKQIKWDHRGLQSSSQYLEAVITNTCSFKNVTNILAISNDYGYQKQPTVSHQAGKPVRFLEDRNQETRKPRKSQLEEHDSSRSV